MDTSFLEKATSGIRNAISAGAGYWIASTLFVQGGVYIAQMLLGRMLPPQEFGVVRTVESYIGILLMIAGAGISSAVLRLVAITPNEERNLLAGQAIALTSLASCLVVAVLIACYRILPHVLPGNSGFYLACLTPCLVTGAISRTVIAHHQGALKLRLVALLSVIPAAMMIPVVVVSIKTFALQGWIYARVFVDAFGFLLILMSVAKAPFFVWNIHLVRSIFGLALPSLLSLSLDKVLGSIDLILLDRVSRDRSAVGYYGAVTVLMAVFLLPAGAINMVGFSSVAQSSGLRAKALTHLRSLLWATIILSLPVAVVFVVLGKSLVHLVFGAQYVLSFSIFLILGATVFLRGAVNCFGSYLLAIGRPSFTIYGNALGVAAVIALSLALIPSFAVEGAALATLGGSIARLVFLGIAAFSVNAAPILVKK